MPRVLLFVLICTTGCGLYGGGAETAPDGDTIDAPIANDATVDATLDVSNLDAGMDAIEEPAPPLPCSTDASVCQGGLPKDWSVVAFAPDRSNTCPVNFTQKDIVANPQAPQAGACTCPCTIVTQPSCSQGTASPNHGLSNTCALGGYSVTFSTDDECVAIPNGPIPTLDNYERWPLFSLKNGTCSGGSASADKSKVPTTAMRSCDVPAACLEDVCNGTSLPAGYQSCIVHDGDMNCPMTTPFKTKAAVIGDDVMFGCGNCSSCSITASCGAAKVGYYDANCVTLKGSIAADNNCNATGNPSGVASVKYAGSVTSTCVAGTSTPGKVDLTGLRTVCCR